jgi:hypothetical protein
LREPEDGEIFGYPDEAYQRLQNWALSQGFAVVKKGRERAGIRMHHDAVMSVFITAQRQRILAGSRSTWKRTLMGSSPAIGRRSMHTCYKKAVNSGSQ